MSGGSFDYLYQKLDYLYLEDIEGISDGLESMAEWLTENKKDEVAAELLSLRGKLIAMAEGIHEIVEAFPTEVIKDAEWWRSGDIGEETFDKMLMGYQFPKENGGE